ncbi:MAG: 4a-hydroxytetrahydrobiopterin dehydratase [Candidatus Doudnabacteria bacterium]|nr:4a-hydroxytetrahydrobiopterin dehydratase [Candidatus Doudnabacteria bacterium]
MMEKVEKIDAQTVSCEPLSEREIEIELAKNLPCWKTVRIRGEKLALARTHTCSDYLDSLELLYSIGQLAENNNHHPDLLLEYKKLTIQYWTHTAGGVTNLDIAEARKVESIIGQL